MRIIAGDYKGRRLVAPNDYAVRPTSDKVKEAMFSILTPEIFEATVADVFAGTGNLGLEALSRGADLCWFGDHAGDSIRMIKENVTMCRAEEYSKIVHGDYRKVLGTIAESGDKVDIFLLDPPYGKGLLQQTMEEIERLELLAEGGMIVCEHAKDEILEDEICGFTKVKERRYGKVVLSIFVC